MVKKVEAVFTATVVKNTEKSGAWLAEVTIQHEGLDNPVYNGYTAWTNATSAKRWVKEILRFNTSRKAIKFVEGEAKDAKGKPVMFTGSISYKADA